MKLSEMTDEQLQLSILRCKNRLADKIESEYLTEKQIRGALAQYQSELSRRKQQQVLEFD